MGYVSGHSAIVFALSTVTRPYLPRGWRALPLVLASAVGLSRLYVGAHMPLDVIGGAGLGVLCGLSTSLVMDEPQSESRRRLVPSARRSSGDPNGVRPISRVGRRDGRIG